MVSQLEVGRPYTIQDILDLVNSPDSPYGPVDRQAAKFIMYNIVRAKRYETEPWTSGEDRLLVLKPPRSDAEMRIMQNAVEISPLDQYLTGLARGCRALCSYFLPQIY